MGNAFTNLSKEINKFNDVLNTMSILIWDSRTKMPKKGANSRGYQVGTLTSVARDILLSSKMRKLLDDSQNETRGFLPSDGGQTQVWCRISVACHKNSARGVYTVPP